MSETLCGGYSAVKDADDAVQQLVDTVRDAAAGEREVTIWKAVKYTSQVVAGTNYRIKVQCGDDVYCHLAVFVPLPYTQEGPKLTAVEWNKTMEDLL